MTYIIIFVAELVEVLLSTIRIVCISKGQKIKGTIAAFLEVLVWVYVINAILDDAMSNPLKVVLFCLAFALGTFIGTIVDDKISKKHIERRKEPKEMK